MGIALGLLLTAGGIAGVEESEGSFEVRQAQLVLVEQRLALGGEPGAAT